MANISKLILITSLILVGLGYKPATAHLEELIEKQAKMTIAVDKETFLDPEYLDISLIIEAPEKSFNAAMAKLHYDPALLEIDTVVLGEDFCYLSIPELPSTPANEEVIICGHPAANATSSTLLADIRFKKLGTGWTSLSLEDSSVLSADGMAREILEETETHNLLLANDSEY